MANIKVVKLTGTSCETTGSIAKVLALASAGPCRIECGSFSTPEAQFTPTSVIESIDVPDGTYIDGPAGRISGSNYLVYIND